MLIWDVVAQAFKREDELRLVSRMDERKMVDISGLDRWRLLKELWDGSYITALNSDGEDCWWCIDRKQVDDKGWVGCYQGRMIGCCLFDESRTLVDPAQYDMENGQGALQHAVDRLRARRWKKKEANE